MRRSKGRRRKKAKRNIREIRYIYTEKDELELSPILNQTIIRVLDISSGTNTTGHSVCRTNVVFM